MTITLTKDEFHEVIVTYITELAEEKGGMINDGTIYSSPVFDGLLQFLKNRGMPSSLKNSYTKMSASSKTKYKKLKSKIDKSEGMVMLL